MSLGWSAISPSNLKIFKDWNAVKPFITNKGAIVNENIIFKAEVDEDVMVKGNNGSALSKTNDLF